METLKVKELREKHGIHDSRNEYTEEQIMELSQRKLYYITSHKEDETVTIHVQYKQASGYVSEDENAVIFIKDVAITGDPENYIPMKKVDHCTKVKTNVYHDQGNNVIYCVNEDDLSICLSYMKEYVTRKIYERMKELENELFELKHANIVFKQI